MAQQYVSNKNETVRMFESNFLEFFSHCHPLTPSVLYLPVVGVMFYLSLWRRNLPIWAVAVLFAAGILIWTLIEYLIHRYIFHHSSQKGWARRFHFIIHGSHHERPKDATRIATTPAITIPLAILFYVLCVLAFGRLAPPVYAGLAMGYILYETIHYGTHHFALKRGIWRVLKKAHLEHHYHDDHVGFGVSSPLWDYVFRTARK
jgi:sterol desaturase/sphingolipid hydroxylase (fatty acid hydroxylase superfamily)